MVTPIIKQVPVWFVRARRNGQKGQAIVEFTLMLPVLLVIVMGIVDFGWGLRSYISITNAAREGARVGVVCGGQSSWAAAQTPITNAVVDKSNGLLSSGNVTLMVDGAAPSGNCTTGQEVAVSAAYDYAYITPLGGLLSLLSGNSVSTPLHMTSTTKMRAE